jgi:hypothetical protein
MNQWVLVWLIVYAVAGLLFFGAALLITVVGTSDLKELLRSGAQPTKAS